MGTTVETALRSVALFRALSSADQALLAGISLVRSYDKGETLFHAGDASDVLFTIVSGRAKVVKALPSGKDVILEIFGPGDPVGAVVAYEERPFPATAVAIESTSCLLTRCAPFFALLERNPTLLRGFLLGLTHRIVELTRRIPEMAGARVETRFAHLFLKLADRLGQRRDGGVFVPMVLSRQDLAELTGTTIETCIRVMSRWGKDGTVLTTKDGFIIANREALEELVSS